MPITPGSDLQYLKKLKPDNYLEIWLGGFENNGIWNNKRCKQFYDHKFTIKQNEKSKKSKKRTKLVKKVKSILKSEDKNFLVED